MDEVAATLGMTPDQADKLFGGFGPADDRAVDLVDVLSFVERWEV